MIPRELDIASNPFCDTKILTYEIYLPPSENKFGFNLLDYEYFKIPYITDTIPNPPDGNKLSTQAKHNVLSITINWEESIIAKGALDELNSHKNTRGKSKVKISLCIWKSYQRTDLEEICSIFDQLRSVVSHLEVRLQNKPTTQNNIGEGLKYSQRKFWKEGLFVQYDKEKNVSLLSAPIPINPPPKGTKVIRSPVTTSIKEGDCCDACKFVARQFSNGSYQNKGIYIDQSYSPVAHADSFRINIAIAAMHIITSSILYVSKWGQGWQTMRTVFPNFV